ncbi:hypothetical protein EOD42_22330 [Rhodovarius crocodyli]|uniref:Uncharacterized protein n=1 Tax=Rhodovarius crocodyli TaxID=1979269 RepID=A0A437M1D7_9PROT|nr:hypothetical protein [Rhodovarius crocodyli]RVT91395.1 hypothetical protein EOD42_22330 [Rhodovarius crocodyli]
MCKCTPEVRTPFCSKPGCGWPAQTSAAPAAEIWDGRPERPELSRKHYVALRNPRLTREGGHLIAWEAGEGGYWWHYALGERWSPAEVAAKWRYIGPWRDPELVETAITKLQAIMDWADTVEARPQLFASGGPAGNLRGPVFDDARAVLAAMDGGLLAPALVELSGNSGGVACGFDPRPMAMAATDHDVRMLRLALKRDKDLGRSQARIPFDMLAALFARIEEDAVALQGLGKAVAREASEAFKGNVAAVSLAGLNTMDVQPLLMAVQSWDISTGRARELLRCWILGTFSPEMLPPMKDLGLAETDDPGDVLLGMRAAREADARALEVRAAEVEADLAARSQTAGKDERNGLSDLARELRAQAAAIRARGHHSPGAGQMVAAPIQVWPFHEAPEALRELSTNGGDEDWLVLIAAGTRWVEETPMWLEEGRGGFGVCCVLRFSQPDGSVVLIGCHS